MDSTNGEPRKLSVKMFIQEYLIEKIERIKDTEPFFAFTLMSIGIEFLGKCLNEENEWDKNRKFGQDFDLALTEIPSLKPYKIYNDLYHNLRCGLAHNMMVKGSLLLSDHGENSKTGISCDAFYNDFKQACEYIMTQASLPVKNLNETYLTEYPDEFKATTGNTTTTM